MRILKLTAENIKKLRTVEITPEGDIVQITGANGSGKSSVLDSIYWALAGKAGISSQPVRIGEERAVITLDLGDITVIRRFGKDGYTSLAVEANGAEYKSPQTLLDKMLGALTFDPLAFARMAQKAQLAELRRVVAVDVDLDALARENAADFAKRTEINRLIKTSEGMIDMLAPVPTEVPVRVDVNALMERLTQVSADNEKVRVRHEVVSGWMQRGDQFQRDAIRNREEAARLLSLADKQDADALELIAKAEDQAKTIPPFVDPVAIRAEIRAATEVNDTVDLYDKRVKLNETLAALEAKADALTLAMNNRTAQRTEAIAMAHFPVEGLGFTDDGVTYNGLPFDQASSAEQLRVSVALAMAANPTLRVLRIKDGSLLDEHSLAMIAQMAHEQDYQVWIESVDTSGLIGIVMEDGQVRGAAVVEPVAEAESSS